MKCPKCGFEMQEGHLICEGCGYEIRIVPDFEPDVEDALTEELLDPFSEEESDSESDFPSDNKKKKQKKLEWTYEEDDDDDAFDRDYDEESPDDFEDDPFGSERKSQILGQVISFLIIAVAVIVLIGVLSAMKISSSGTPGKNSKSEKPNNEAIDAYNVGNYDLALSLLDDQEGFQNEFLRIRCIEASDEDEAILAFEGLDLSGYDVSEEELNEYYGEWAKLLLQHEYYQKLADLLEVCPVPTPKAMYAKYAASPPAFSCLGGGYEEPIRLKLSTSNYGMIYYTTDGTDPTDTSMLYTSPIPIGKGNTEVKAIFINSYGVSSHICSQTYVINLDQPEPPELELDNGIYHDPVMVEVLAEESCQIFYTTDNSTPTEESVPYTGPIPMPLGTTNFKFVAINPLGVSSEYTQRTFVLQLENAISPATAVNTLVNHLVEIGYITDTAGHLSTGTATFHFSSVIRTADGHDYYTVYEKITTSSGTSYQTQTVYLIEVRSGQTAKLNYDSSGAFIAIPF